MRTAIRDVAEGADMGLETGVGRSGEIVCVRCSFRNTESFKIMEDLIRECVSIFA